MTVCRYLVFTKDVPQRTDNACVQGIVVENPSVGNVDPRVEQFSL